MLVKKSTVSKYLNQNEIFSLHILCVNTYLSKKMAST